MWTFIYHSKTLSLQPCMKVLPNLATKSMRTCRLLSFSSSSPCFPYSLPINLLFFSFSGFLSLFSHSVLFLIFSLDCRVIPLCPACFFFVCLHFFLICNKASAWSSLKVDSTWAIFQLRRLHFLHLVNYLVYKDILHAVSEWFSYKLCCIEFPFFVCYCGNWCEKCHHDTVGFFFFSSLSRISGPFFPMSLLSS